jgi:MinD-like ATPase involved in chromosome partitioning or flagellar assembly
MQLVWRNCDWNKCLSGRELSGGEFLNRNTIRERFVYVATFYSFKGGVGRTLALVNVAIALSKAGKRVLLVDFDLEAPGIDTFEILRPSRPHFGVVEYVTDFLATLTAPKLEPYVYEVEGSARGKGRIWIMPAGMGDDAYRQKLANINWQDLYSKFEGFLLFEDLKTQWEQTLRPDYVLIDSRTGYTEVEGICTRQFPNAVVLLFFPNEQNLVGLRQVVADIRGEATGARQKQIQLHFVMSNVPDLDDEDQILTKRMKTFRKELGYEELTATVHRYDSLALLDQIVFTHARPKSRLAREYVALKDAIVAENLEDREAAVRFLKESFRPWGFQFALVKEELESRLEKIQCLHKTDGEILSLLALVRKSERRFEEALLLLDHAIACGNRTGEALLERAGIRQEVKDKSGSLADINDALGLPNLGARNVDKAIRMLRFWHSSGFLDVARSRAVTNLSLDDRVAIAGSLQRSKQELLAGLEILTSIVVNAEVNQATRRTAQLEMVLCLLGLGRCAEATALIESAYPDLNGMPVPIAFNYAMAMWGKNGRITSDLFARVVKKQSEGKGANFFQCLSIANWALGHNDAAGRYVEMAETRITQTSNPTFSCWRYNEATPRQFLEDCHQIRRLIAGEEVRPAFIAANET